MDDVIEFCETVILFHKKAIKRARLWSIVASIVGGCAIFLGIVVFKDGETLKSFVSVGGLVLSSIGLSWPIREIYNLTNRRDILQIISAECRARVASIPPPVTPEEKKDYKKKIEELLNKI